MSLSLFALPASASEYESLFGEWGTDEQCARAKFTPDSTKLRAPFDIRSDWLGHGSVWCQLSWYGVTSTTQGVYAAAQARCGEDSIQSYHINFSLEGEQLSIVWNLTRKNGPLKHCPDR